jgi:DNA-binding HxlR family transcriptional regulator
MPAPVKVQTPKPAGLDASAAAAEGRGSVVRLERNCSMARMLDIFSDAWSILILREAFFGAKTFEAFRSTLGIPRATLTDRLKKLTRLEIFDQVATGVSQRKEYRLTTMAVDSYSSFVALMQFGERWLSHGKPSPLTLVHMKCGCECHPVVVCSHCGERITAREVTYRDGPGAGRHPAKAGRNARRASDGSRLLLGRPSLVTRALQVIGDKWSFVVVREAFFGNRRYDKIQTELAIAPNILTDRLSRLVAGGVLYRRQYQSSPDRYEYLLTDMGHDLYGSFAAMLHWGDRWLSGGKPPLLLKHLTCGHDFHAAVVCDHCKVPIEAGDMQYKLTYDPKAFGALGPRSIT